MKLELISWPVNGEPEEGVLRQRLEAEGFAVWCWSDEAGTTYEPHSHEEDESLWVVDGEIVFGVDGSEYRMGRGDRLMLPRGTVHTATVGTAGATYLVGQRRC